MNTMYTLLVVAAIFAVAIPVGRRLYPNGSGSAFPAWVDSLPNVVLITAGVVGTGLGLESTWVSGQVLFAQGGPSVASWLPLIGILAGVLIALKGISLFGVVLLKKNISQRGM